MTRDTVEIARRVLVKGESHAALAKERGLARLHVNRIVSKVRAIANEIPDGWERVEVYSPSDLASKFRTLAEEAGKSPTCFGYTFFPSLQLENVYRVHISSMLMQE